MTQHKIVHSLDKNKEFKIKSKSDESNLISCKNLK